jgi:hypothetical protein
MRKNEKNDSPKSYWISGEPHGNFSLDKRDTFDPKNKYIGVRLQQGVPLLDRDWNELEDIRRYQDMSFRKHFLGDGSPDDGGRITVSSDGADLFIKKGRYLVDGLEVEIADDNGSTGAIPLRILGVTLNWPLTNPPESRTDQVYLEVTIAEIGSKETNPSDSNLGNIDDVGRETCIRHKLMWTVKVEEGKEMPPSDQFFHRSLLATITRKGSIILAEEISDKRSRLRTFLSGEEGRLRVNGPLDGGLRVKEGLVVESGGQYIGPVAEGFAGLVIENGGLWIKAGGLSVDSGGVLNAYGPLNAKSGININGDLKVDGFVGIGTSTPSFNFNIDPKRQGGILIGNPNTSEGGFTSLRIQISAEKDGHSELQSIKKSGSEWGDLCLNPIAGNVGIGTATPQSKLEVAGDVLVAGVANIGWLHVREWMDVKKGVGIEGGLTVSSGGANISPGLGVNGPLGVTGALDVKGGVTISGGLTVTTGNIGIGTSTPSFNLNIDPKCQGGILIGNPNTSKGGFTSLRIQISAEKDGHSELQSIKKSGSEWGDLCLNPISGNVGVGTATPRSKLEVAGDVLIVGNVGVGTATPQSKLHVAGDVQVDGAAGIGWLHVREWMDVKKGVGIEGGLTVSSGITKLNGRLDLGHGVVLCSWFEDKVGDWFGIFYNGTLKAYCDLNTGQWKTDRPILLQFITG